MSPETDNVMHNIRGNDVRAGSLEVTCFAEKQPLVTGCAFHSRLSRDLTVCFDTSTFHRRRSQTEPKCKSCTFFAICDTCSTDCDRFVANTAYILCIGVQRIQNAEKQCYNVFLKSAQSW